MQKHLGTGLGCAVLAAAGGSTHAFQAADLFLYQKGPVALKPQFELTETFNDNITYRHDDKQADLITTVSPGLEFQFGSKDLNFISVRYFFDYLHYLDNDDLDAHQHRLANTIRYQKSRLTLDGRDVIEFLSSPIGGGYSSSAGTGDQSGTGLVGLSGAKVDRLTYYDLYRLAWDFSERTDFYVRALHSFVNYQDDLTLYDSRTVSGTIGIDYHPLAKTYFFGETYYGVTENTENAPLPFDYPRVNFIGFFIGARGQFTERLKGTAKAGYEHRWYSDQGDDLGSPVVEISLEEQLSERTLLNASYSRHTYESVQFVLSPYTTDAIALSWLQLIGTDGRLKSMLRVGYAMSDFETNSRLTGGRSDDVILAGLTLTYDIKFWMRVFGSYNFEHLNSNDPAVVDYNVNRVALGLQLGY